MVTFAPGETHPIFRTLSTAYLGLKGLGQTWGTQVGVGVEVKVLVMVGVKVGVKVRVRVGL
jgi:hypothetical protein